MQPLQPLKSPLYLLSALAPAIPNQSIGHQRFDILFTERMLRFGSNYNHHHHRPLGALVAPLLKETSPFALPRERHSIIPSFLSAQTFASSFSLALARCTTIVHSLQGGRVSLSCNRLRCCAVATSLSPGAFVQFLSFFSLSFVHSSRTGGLLTSYPTATASACYTVLFLPRIEITQHSKSNDYNATSRIPVKVSRNTKCERWVAVWKVPYTRRSRHQSRHGLVSCWSETGVCGGF